MQTYKKANCPSCGAKSDQIDRFAQMAVCDYCGSAFYFKDEAILAMGEMAILVEYPTPLYVHATGHIKGKAFDIIGRVRYRYSRGFWDEWYLRYDDGGFGWIVEDEQEYSLERTIENPGAVPPLQSLNPGSRATIAGQAVFVDERDEAHFEGAEGSLPFLVSENRRFPYVDASQGETTVTIEYGEEGTEVFVGHFIDVGDIALDHPKEDMQGYGWSEA
ncbi:MAG: DUF4178 domain-containing protein [Sumerlaeia bacterium]